MSLPTYIAEYKAHGTTYVAPIRATDPIHAIELIESPRYLARQVLRITKYSVSTIDEHQSLGGSELHDVDEVRALFAPKPQAVRVWLETDRELARYKLWVKDFESIDEFDRDRYTHHSVIAVEKIDKPTITSKWTHIEEVCE